MGNEAIGSPENFPQEVAGPQENYEITVTYQADGSEVKEDSFIGVKHIGMTQDGFFRLVTADGTLVDYSIPRIVKRTSRVMAVSLV